MTAHVITESHWTSTDTRGREWFACACGATWMAPTDKPGKCPTWVSQCSRCGLTYPAKFGHECQAPTDMERLAAAMERIAAALEGKK